MTIDRRLPSTPGRTLARLRAGLAGALGRYRPAGGAPPPADALAWAIDRFTSPPQQPVEPPGPLALQPERSASALPDRGGACLLSVCTCNHLHFARVLLESWRRHHPDLPAYLVVTDWDGVAPLALEGAWPLSGAEVAGGALPFMALKYGAADLCCALKPYGLQYLLDRTGHDRIVYADSDQAFFAAATALLRALDDASFVVTPHALAPLPHPERFWERPTLGDLAYAGPLNAGLFGVRADTESRRFVELWIEMVTAPGAFLPSLGGQMEQNSFNWVTYFADGVRILRDRAYNVAYWNLHDRSLRCAELDGERPEPAWTVDGEPLVTFHFSGFSPDRPTRLSRYDQRHSLYHLPSLARLCQHYAARLFAHGAAEQSRLAYRYDRFPSGVPIDARMRRLFKEHEIHLRTELDPWTPAGEAHYCTALLSVAPATGSLIPLLFDEVLGSRPDLERAYPRARTHPEGLLRWINAHGIYECGYEQLFDLHRPSRVNGEALPMLASLRHQRPELFEGLERPLGGDRQRLIGRLEEAGLASTAELVRTGDLERYRLSVLWVVRRAYEQRPDVARAFPEPLSADAERFIVWLRDFGQRECLLPEGAADLFADRVRGGRALARIYSHLSRDWQRMERWPLGLVGVETAELARTLLAMSRHGLEYDLEDIVLLLWIADLEPWLGLALTLELPVNARRRPSPLLDDGQEQLLAPVLAGDRRFRRELERYRREHSTERHLLQAEAARQLEQPRRDRDVLVERAVERRLLARLDPAAGVAPAAPEPLAVVPRPKPLPVEAGVNVFGYHRSPTGLGSLTRGLMLALGESRTAACPVTIGNTAMSADLCASDFVRAWDPRLDTNLFVSYPHLHEMLLEGLPEHVVRGRRNIAYMAWEQRDGSPYWPVVLDGFDQVWAISSFAAEALSRCLGRPVHALLPTIEFDALPPASTKAEAGFDPDSFVFLYVFDASSSVERKNPEAAIAAFARAFSPEEPVSLVLRVSSAHRADHRERLRRLLRRVPAGARVQLRLEPMGRERVLGLLSAADCYVSLHRAEGFGYTCAEAMAYGRPVVASGYSGNLDFMTPENSYLVRCAETTVTVPDGPFQRGSVWAEPSVEHAAQQLREVYQNRERAAAVGARAASDVRAQLSPAAIGERVRELLGYGGRSSGELSVAGRAGG